MNYAEIMKVVEEKGCLDDVQKLEFVELPRSQNIDEQRVEIDGK